MAGESMTGSEDRFPLSRMNIQLTLLSASDINDGDLLRERKVYAVAWIEDGSRPVKQKTRAIEMDKNPNPSWNKQMSFIVDEEALGQGRLSLIVELRLKTTETEEIIDGKKVDDVSIPIQFLATKKIDHTIFYSYWVRDSSRRPTVKLDCAFKTKLEVKSNPKGRTAPESKERNKVPVTTLAPLLTNLPKRKEIKKKKKGKKVPLNACTELAPPLPHGSYPQYPLQWQYPSLPLPTIHTTTIHNTTIHHPPNSGYPYPPFTTLGYSHQAAYPNPNLSFPPYTAEYPKPNPTFPPYADYAAQYLAPGGQYPLQQAYPQQGGSIAYSGCPSDQGGNILPYTVCLPAPQT